MRPPFFFLGVRAAAAFLAPLRLSHGFMWMKGWRCMHCGHAADPVIEANLRLHGATVLVQGAGALAVVWLSADISVC